MNVQGRSVFRGALGKEGRPRGLCPRVSAVRCFTTHLGIRLRRILRCAAGGASGRDSPWIPIIFKGFFKGGKGVGLSLYRLPNHCHADSLIPADRFLRKEKSSFLRAGYFLRRRWREDFVRAAKPLVTKSPERNRTRSGLSASYFLRRLWG